MNDEEKIVSEKDLEKDGELYLYKSRTYTGICIDYFRNGQKMSERNYKDGKKHGLSKYWYKGGQKKKETNQKVHHCRIGFL